MPNLDDVRDELRREKVKGADDDAVTGAESEFEYMADERANQLAGKLPKSREPHDPMDVANLRDVLNNAYDTITDGELEPIEDHADDGTVPPRVAARLQALHQLVSSNDKTADYGFDLDAALTNPTGMRTATAIISNLAGDKKAVRSLTKGDMKREGRREGREDKRFERGLRQEGRQEGREDKRLERNPNAKTEEERHPNDKGFVTEEARQDRKEQRKNPKE